MIKFLIMFTEAKDAAFTAPMKSHLFAGLLLDLDGTIVDSTEAIVKHWHKSVSPTVCVTGASGCRVS